MADAGSPGRGLRAELEKSRREGWRALPVVTLAVLAACVVGWLVQYRQFGASPSAAQLYEVGGITRRSLEAGDWWRIVTSSFLHSGVGHFASNLAVIALMGFGAERFLGHVRLALVVLTSMVVAGVGATVGVGHDTVTIGASGIAFGIVAATVVADRGFRDGVGMLGAQLLVINLIITFAVASISVGGHLGGALGGSIVALERRLRARPDARADSSAERPRLSPAAAFPADQVLVLREARGSGLGYVPVAIALVLFGAWLGNAGQVLGWVLAAAGLLAVVNQVREVARPAELQLTPEGLVLRRSVGGSEHVHWSDVDVFLPGSVGGPAGAIGYRHRTDGEQLVTFVAGGFVSGHVLMAVLLELWRQGTRVRPEQVDEALLRTTLDEARERYVAMRGD